MPNDATFLLARLRELRQWLQANGQPEATLEDAWDELADDCGRDPQGGCHLAGSEYCEFECPFSD
jgi:hypothetical protein